MGPQPRPRGTPSKISEQPRDWICVIARCDSRSMGRPFSCWSLTKLRDYLIETGRVTTISIETVRRILHEQGVTWQTSKTWKASNDPDFVAKIRRILALYDHPPAGGKVVCVDELGPLNLQLRPGKAWKPVGEPVRLPARYHRDQGVRHMIASLDLATGRIHYRIRDRKRSGEFLDFLTTGVLDCCQEHVTQPLQACPVPGPGKAQHPPGDEGGNRTAHREGQTLLRGYLVCSHSVC
jgi:hypothetical protein